MTKMPHASMPGCYCLEAMKRLPAQALITIPVALLAACSGDSDTNVSESAAEAVATVKESSSEALGRILDPATRALDQLKGYQSEDITRLDQLRQLISLDDFNGLLDDVMEELGFSPEESARETIRRNRIEIADLNQRAQSIREKLAGAPRDEDVGFFKDLYTDSQEELREDLAQAKARLKSLQAEDAELQRRVQRELQELGLDLSRDDVSTLLSTVTGEDFMELVVATNTVRAVAVQLERLAGEPDAPTESARRYYGVYLIMLYAMERLHVQFIQRIEGELLPRLAEIEREAERLIERSEQRTRAGGDAAIAAQNQASNELTIRAAALYTLYLTQQADGIQERVDALRSNIADAEITYETISLSGEVARIIRSGLQDLDSLLELQPPPMARLESPELREEFSRLSERMVTP